MWIEWTLCLSSSIHFFSDDLFILGYLLVKLLKCAYFLLDPFVFWDSLNKKVFLTYIQRFIHGLLLLLFRNLRWWVILFKNHRVSIREAFCDFWLDAFSFRFLDDFCAPRTLLWNGLRRRGIRILLPQNSVRCLWSRLIPSLLKVNCIEIPRKLLLLDVVRGSTSLIHLFLRFFVNQCSLRCISEQILFAQERLFFCWLTQKNVVDFKMTFLMSIWRWHWWESTACDHCFLANIKRLLRSMWILTKLPWFLLNKIQV